MKLSSQAFSSGDFIPKKYTCDGEDMSPPVRWTDQPEQTHSLALIFEDPDAPSKTWIHWVLYNIPPHLQEIGEDQPDDSNLDDGMMHGINDFGKKGYGGPCPPGGTHRYFMRLFALDTDLDLKPGLKASQLREMMSGHIIAEAELMGRYQRS